MRLVVSETAADLIAEQGGRLYVWVHKSRCCNGLRTLETATQPPAGTDFTSVGSDGGRIEVFVPTALSPRPDELQVEARRFPRRVEAYWDGCAWVT